MDAILAGATIHQRRQALYSMSNGFGIQDAYNTTLDRIRQPGGSKADLGLRTLMWISHSARPLVSEELRHALGVELGAEDFTVDNVPSIRSIVGCTLGLVTIDEEASTLHLLHHTLQEYLRQHPTLFVTPHSMMAEICLTYLNFRSARALPSSLLTTLETLPFLEYATSFWGTHATREVTERTKFLSLRLLDRYENHVSAAIFWRKIGNWDWEEGIRGISGLHCIAFWGIAEIGTAMLEKKIWDVNVRDLRGDTPLMWAVRYRNETMVELFLRQEDIKPDSLLQHDRTVLSLAASWGNEGIVKLLLKRREVNPDSPDCAGRTPLSFAVSRGHEGVVELLLDRWDVNPDSSDNDGRTPLSYAVRGRHKGVIKLLLERCDVDPNLSDNNGQTPLSIAVESGNEGAVELLLNRSDANPNSLSSDGRTVLSFAVWNGCESLVKLLLKRGDVNPNIPDHSGRTLLSLFAEWGNESIVKMLLELGDANPNSRDHDGKTPLSFALLRGRKSVVILLREWRSANPKPQIPRPFSAGDPQDSSDNNGRTLLSIAAEAGDEALVKRLLGLWDAGSDSPDSNGRIPLSYPATRRQGGKVKLFLECSDGRTRLSFTFWGFEGVVKLPLDLGDVNLDSLDIDGRTLLSYFITREPREVVSLSLERRGANSNPLYSLMDQHPYHLMACTGKNMQ